MNRKCRDWLLLCVGPFILDQTVLAICICMYLFMSVDGLHWMDGQRDAGAKY